PDILLLPPVDALEAIASVDSPVKTTILDPWYNKGIGGVVDGYIPWLKRVIAAAAENSEHVFVWGFPEIIHSLVDDCGTRQVELVCWLTWYYKNCPSVIRGWRSSQNACLHFARPGSALHPEHFLNTRQLELQEEGKLRYLPAPGNV